MFRDNYTNFIFNELKSENFKVWITNKHDLKRNMSPNFSDKYNTPSYGQIRYHEGTTIDKQDFQLSCVAVDVTLNEWRAICEWLSPLQVGKLRFDWNDKYYYMVKISKAPQGTMFIKNKIDKVLGQLYIIEFNIDFTTVEDWAALGDYQQINLNNSLASNVINNNYKVPFLVYNNTKVIDHTFNSQSRFTSGDVVEVTNIGTKSDTTLFNIYSCKNELLASIDKITIDSKIKVRYYYGENKDNYYDLPCTIDTISPTQKKIIFSFVSSPQEQLGYVETDEVTSIKCTILNNLKLTNPASYNLYPIIYCSGHFSISKNGVNCYSFDSKGTDDVVILDNKNMIATCNNQLLSTSKKYTNVQENKRLVIESGRPQMVKARFIEEKEILQGNNQTGLFKATFQISNRLLYGRHSPYFAMFFNKKLVDLSNQYDIDNYGSELYTNPDLSPSVYRLLDTPIIEQRIESDKILIDIYYLKTDSYNNKGSLIFNGANNDFYISLCDYSLCDVDADSPNLVSIGFQTREVI